MAEGTTNEATAPSGLTEQVFVKFKVYLAQNVECLSATLSTDASGRTKALERQSEGQTLKFPGNKDQYLFNASLEDSLSPFSTRRICSRDAKRKQEFSNVIGWRKSSLLRQPITLPDSCFRFASREQIRLVENGL